MNPWIEAGATLLVTAAFMTAGVYLVLILDRLVGSLVAFGVPRWRRAMVDPIKEAALAMLQQPTVTERPDAAGWAFAPALLGGLAAAALVVIIPGPGSTVEMPAGLVLFGAATALVTIAVFLHGWSANSVFPLIGTYRFVALALSIEIPFFLVLIAAALPAESLGVGDVVRSQSGIWNVVRQPLGLPIYLLGGLGVAFWGPLGFADADDLAGGTLAEVSGFARITWLWGQAAVLVAVAGMGAAAFLGGWLGPWLPGWLWLALKTGLLLLALVATRHMFARVRLERFVVFAWTVLIPLALMDVFLSGILLL